MEDNSHDEVARTEAFKELMRRKRNFIVPAVVFILLFYLPWSALSVFTTVLNGQVIGAINWAVIYAYANFIVAIVFCYAYSAKAVEFDRLGERAKEEARDSVEESV